MRIGGTTLVVLCLMLLGTATARGQGEGVTVDPDSPTAKQYKLPIESARQQANPQGGGKLVPPGEPASGTSAVPLFGEGITPAGTRGSSKRPGGTERGRTKSSPSSDSTTARGSAAAPLKAAVQNPGAPSGGVGAPLLFAGGAAMLLLLATAVGLMLRRRRSD